MYHTRYENVFYGINIFKKDSNQLELSFIDFENIIYENYLHFIQDNEEYCFFYKEKIINYIQNYINKDEDFEGFFLYDAFINNTFKEFFGTLYDYYNQFDGIYELNNMDGKEYE